MFFRRLATTALMTAILAVPTTAAAQPTSDLDRLVATAEREGWGPAEWAWFESWVNWIRLLDIMERANAGDRYAIEQYVWILWGDHAAQMGRIITRESGWNPTAKNPTSTASGLTQQLNIHAWRYTRRGWDWTTDRFNAVRNLEIAHELWSESGWRPWACC